MTNILSGHQQDIEIFVATLCASSVKQNYFLIGVINVSTCFPIQVSIITACSIIFNENTPF